MLATQAIEPHQGNRLQHVNTGEFELSVLTQDVAPVATLAGASSSSVTMLTTLEEMRGAVNRVAASAQRLLSIYTPDLEPDLYDNTEFLDIVKRFVLARNFAKVRVMLEDAGRVQRDTNRFMAMARRLTSYIDIRPVTTKIPQGAEAYVIADDRALVLRPQRAIWQGLADFDNRIVARTQLERFDALWQSHQPQVSLRIASR